MRRIFLAGMLGVWMAGGYAAVGSASGVMYGTDETDYNTPPSISGSPPRAAAVGESYDFEPDASDPDNDALSFSIVNKPDWASFDESTGRLSGTPRAGDVGIYSNIRILVSDWQATTTLTFRIAVSQSADGAVTLSWEPPTRNEDGSQLTDLAGYRIYVGRNPNDFSRVIVLDNPGVTRYVVERLSPATWHFAMTSVNGEGRESRKSAVVKKTIG
jgi:hypothetical protein